MTGEELKAEIARSPMVCSRCSLVECTCWGEHGARIGMAPTGKAFNIAMKLAYRDIDWSKVKLPKMWRGER